MEKTCDEQGTESLYMGIVEIPGEPAIVINGVPNIPPDDGALTSSDTTSDSESEDAPVFGEWLEGRGVRKMFGDQYYSGKVVKFDEESKWYRVVYEDDDFEDLEWHELEEVLLPLDLAFPLKALALKIHRRESPVDMSGENAMKSRKNHAKNLPRKRNPVEPGDGASVPKKRGRPRKANADGLKERKGNVDGLKEKRTFFGNAARAENRKRKEIMLESNLIKAKEDS